MTNEECLISSILSEAQKKFNQKNFKEALDIISLLITKNFKILALRAKIYYYQSEYYKSLQDCEECLKLSVNDNTNTYIEIYQLEVLNYIKMFDLDKAKEKLKKCQNINKDILKNSELFFLIQQEEKKK